MQITYWYEELKKAVEHFESLVNQLDSRLDTGSAITNLEHTESACETAYSRIMAIKKSYNLELKLVKDRTVKTDHEVKSKVLENEVTELQRRFKELKDKANKDELLKSSIDRDQSNLQGRGNDDLLNQAHGYQDLTFESLARTRNLIEQSEEVGKGTLAQLKEQHEQMEEVENEIDVMDSNLLRAEKLILNFGRRMATDRVIQLFSFVNIVVLLSLILYVAISGNSLSASSTDGSQGITGPVGPPPTVRPTFNPA